MNKSLLPEVKGILYNIIHCLIKILYLYYFLLIHCFRNNIGNISRYNKLIKMVLENTRKK